MSMMQVRIATGGRALQRVEDAHAALPPPPDGQQWRITVGHDDTCPSLDVPMTIEGLKVCNCEMLKLLALLQPNSSLEEALKDPEFLLSLFKDGIAEGFSVDPNQEEE